MGGGTATTSAPASPISPISPTSPFVKLDWEGCGQLGGGSLDEIHVLRSSTDNPVSAKEQPSTGEPPPSATTVPARATLIYMLLIGLYVMQGVPLGLVFGTIPYMIKSMKSSTLSYSQFGLFSLAGYPYSLKLLWSPLVDHFYSQRLGRRKTWILPTQLMVGVLFFALGCHIDRWIAPGVEINFWRLNGCFLLLVSLCATLDIAVDGWALSLLPPTLIHYASTCQSIGVNVGLFISFTVFLALGSERFCNQFLRSAPQPGGLFTLGQFMLFWAAVYVTTTILLMFKREPLSAALQRQQQKRATDSTVVKIATAYRTLWSIVMLPSVRIFAAILLSFKFGFSAYDAVAPLKLLEKGFPKESLALAVLIDFPFQMAMGVLVARWAAGSRPLRPWIMATYARIVMSFVGLYVISKFPGDQATASYTALIIATTVLTSFCHTAMFVSLGAYFVKISDPKYGGTYLTLLNTLSNFAGMWPKLPVMSAVDWLTSKRCIGAARTLVHPSCASKADGISCVLAGGKCHMLRDGFYPVASLCLIVGLILFQLWIRPAVQKLEKIPKSSWTVHSQSSTSVKQ